MANIKFGDLSAGIGHDKIIIEDGLLKVTGTIVLNINGKKQIFSINDKRDQQNFTDKLITIVKRAKLNTKDENRLIIKIKTLWGTYKSQYNENKKVMAKKPVTKKEAAKKTVKSKAIKNHFALRLAEAKAARAKEKKKDFYRQTGSSVKYYDEMIKARAPGRRKSDSGNLYYERRKNRSDVPGTLSGSGNTENFESVDFWLKMFAPRTPAEQRKFYKDFKKELSTGRISIFSTTTQRKVQIRALKYILGYSQTL
jgi:hypothetical protein